jgi:histidine triad (HIT) family protein
MDESKGRRWMKKTLFTKIVEGDIPSSKVAEGDLWYAFLDINPWRMGHTLVVPREPAQRISELSIESRNALMEGVVEVQRRLSIEFKTSDFSVNVNDGPQAGQEVPHTHIHVIPRCVENDNRPLWTNKNTSTPDFVMLEELSKRLQSL